MIGIILGGGHGIGLKPLTDHMPKSLIKINGRPILEQIIYYMRCAGISDIRCISGVQEPVRPWLETYYPQIRIVNQDAPMGTGQAVHLALSDLTSKKGQGLVVMRGDIIPTSLAMADIIRREPAYSALSICQSDTPEEGAAVELDRQRWLTRVEDKRENPSSDKILTGIFYFADSERFFSAQEKLMRFGVKLKGEYDIIGAITMMHQYGESFKCVDSHVFDCGTPERLKKAEEYFANEMEHNGDRVY